MQDMPEKYIYEPWTAPEEVQRKANCIIGKDYPKPLVDHATKHKVQAQGSALLMARSSLQACSLMPGAAAQLAWDLWIGQPHAACGRGRVWDAVFAPGIRWPHALHNL